MFVNKYYAALFNMHLTRYTKLLNIISFLFNLCCSMSRWLTTRFNPICPWPVTRPVGLGHRARSASSRESRTEVTRPWSSELILESGRKCYIGQRFHLSGVQVHEKKKGSRVLAGFCLFSKNVEGWREKFNSVAKYFFKLEFYANYDVISCSIEKALHTQKNRK